MIFEIVNPSDPYTMVAEDVNVAIAAVLILGRGQYELKDKDDNIYGATLVFASKEDIDDRLLNWFGEDGLDGFISKHIDKVIECFDSVACVDFRERFLYDKAMSFMDEESKKKFREEVHDRFRSSMNDIGAAAWHCADWYREKKK